MIQGSPLNAAKCLLAIRSLELPEKACKLFDGGGLYLLVKPNGARLWRMKYRVDGREKLISFGQYPGVALKSARERRDEARRLIAARVDPSAKLSALPRSTPSRRLRANTSS